MARPGLSRNAKFRRLVRMLGEPEPHVRGYLELLWETGYENGNPVIGDSETVEAAAMFPGEPGALFVALRDCGGAERNGFIEPADDRPSEWQIHDLFDHAPEYVKKRMERESRRQARGQSLSDIRAEAGRKGGSKRKQTATFAKQTEANGKQTETNGATPAPAPAPAPAPDSSCRTLRFDEEDRAIAEWMFSLIRKLDPEHKQPNLAAWANTIRLMREQDRRAPEDIRAVFAWANQDSFWQSNILSADKLREQFDRLTLKRKGIHNGNGSHKHNGKRTLHVGPGQRHEADRCDQEGAV